MEDEVERFPVLRFTKEDRSNTELAVAKEFLFTIFLNDQELATLLCSPGNLQYLAVGFLASEGLLKSKNEIKSMSLFIAIFFSPFFREDIDLSLYAAVYRLSRP